MSAPIFTETDTSILLPKVYTKSDFNKTIMAALRKFYKRDDNGKFSFKKQLNVAARFVGISNYKIKENETTYGYDKMYENILKIYKKLPGGKLLSGDYLKGILKLLQDYKKDKYPNESETTNKKRYVLEIAHCVGLIINNLDNWADAYKNRALEIKKLKNRDLAGYYKNAKLHANAAEIKELLKCYKKEITERSKDPKQKKDIEINLNTTTVH